MPKKDKIPDFSFNDLLASMREGVDHAAGKITARTVHLKTRPAVLSAKDIAEIRENLNVSQAVFADLLNVPKATAISWERGLRSPSGAALRLLHIAKNTPAALVDA
ncbi:MAG: helix-turn-helix domain-containing protein [Verrucomicrobiota bacterium]